jgi:hypothetical protein
MLKPRELEKILVDSAAAVLVCQDDLYAESGEAAADAAGVPHVITTSALDFLAPGTVAPALLAGVRRETAAWDAGSHQSHRPPRAPRACPVALTATTRPS